MTRGSERRARLVVRGECLVRAAQAQQDRLLERPAEQLQADRANLPDERGDAVQFPKPG